MELDISRQALGLALAALMGMGAGIVYDILRPFRRRGGKLMAALLDCLFSLSVAAASFLYAMGAESGRLGLWELSMTLLGFLAYMYLISDSVYKLTDGALTAVLSLKRLIVNKIIFFADVTKKCFHNVRK